MESVLTGPRQKEIVPDPRQNSTEFCVACMAMQQLHSSGFAALRLVRCEHEDGAVVIQGTVPSYFLKQTAQERVGSIAEVKRVVNELKVHDPRRQSTKSLIE